MRLPDFTFHYKPHKSGLGTVMGELEAEVMETIWGSGEATARQVLDELGTKRKIAYNTVNTILKRLVDKGLLKQELNGRTFSFIPTISSEALKETVVKKTINSLMSEFNEPFNSTLKALLQESKKEIE